VSLYTPCVLELCPSVLFNDMLTYLSKKKKKKRDKFKQLPCKADLMIFSLLNSTPKEMGFSLTGVYI
jgi:hypothetical protein